MTSKESTRRNNVDEPRSSKRTRRVLRWGIVGTGKISNDFANALRTVKDAKIVAVAARSESSALRFATTHGVDVGLKSYEEMYVRDDVDVVYVGTIHPVHYDQVKACLMNGKHVLCEKPLTMSAKQTRELIELSKRKGVRLQEGMWTRYFPCVLKAKQLIADGVIGEVMMVRSSFGVRFEDWDSNTSHRVLDPKLGGSAVLDIGVYPLAHALFAFADEGMPKITCSGVMSPLTGTDVSCAVSMTFGERHVASCTTTITADLPNETVFVGSKGQIFLHTPSHAPTKMTLKIRKGRDTFASETFEFAFPKELKESRFNFPNSEGFVYEARAMTSAILQDDTDALDQYCSNRESLMLARITDHVRSTLGSTSRSSTS